MFQEERRTFFFLPYLREPVSKLKTSAVQLDVVVHFTSFLWVKTRRMAHVRGGVSWFLRERDVKWRLPLPPCFSPWASLSKWMRPSGPWSHWTEQQHRTSGNATGREERSGVVLVRMCKDVAKPPAESSIQLTVAWSSMNCCVLIARVFPSVLGKPKCG